MSRLHANYNKFVSCNKSHSFASSEFSIIHSHILFVVAFIRILQFDENN